VRKFTILPLALLLLAAQTPKLPLANPLPYQEADTAAVMKPIDAIFAAFEAGDATAVLAQIYPDGRVTATGRLRDGTSGVSGVRQQNWSQFAERIGPDAKFQERITDPAVEIDGDIAMVWAPFVVRVDGKVSNCGFDHFDLVRGNGVWKIMNLTFSSRVTDCGN
jgi:hypothetical protein